MINGPGNVWIERARKAFLRPMPRLTWTKGRSLRAAIHISRPLGLDPASDADHRCPARGWFPRGHLCSTRQSSRRYHRSGALGSETFSCARISSSKKRAAGERAEGSRAERALMTRGKQHPGIRWDRIRQDHACSMRSSNCYPARNALWLLRTRLELRIEPLELCPVRGSGAYKKGADHDPRSSTPRLASSPGSHRGGRSTRRRGGGPACKLLNTGHGGSLTTVHANNAESASVAPCQLRDAGWR